MRRLVTIQIIVAVFALVLPAYGLQAPDSKTEELIQSLKSAEELRLKAVEALKARRVELQKELVKIDQALGQMTPEPKPDPDPVLNDVATRVKELVERDVPQYVGRDKTKEGLSIVYATIAQKIAIGQPPFDVTPSIISATGEEVVKILGAHVGHWRVFFASLGEYLKSLAQRGELPTPGSHAIIWKDIASGLKAAK